MDQEIGALAEKGPTEGELQRAVASFASTHWRHLAPVPSRSHIVGSVETVHGRADFLNELPGRLAQVTPNQVVSATEEILHQHRAVYELVPERAA